MSARFRLKGGREGYEAAVMTDELHRPGLMTYTHPADHYTWSSGILSNDIEGSDLTSPISGSVTFKTLYSGEGGGWLVENPTNAFIIDSTSPTFAGSYAIDATQTRNQDFLLLSDSNGINPREQRSLRLRVYIEKPTTSQDVVFSWENNGAYVGSTISVKPYIDPQVENQWQLVEIPFSDFNLDSIPAVTTLRITTIDATNKTSNYHLDSIILISVSGGEDSISYTFHPAIGEQFNLLSLNLIAYNSASASASPLEFFGLPALTNGCVLNFRDKSRVYTSLIFRDLWSMLQIGSSRIESIPDGTGAITTVRFQIPRDQLQIDGSKDQYIELIVRDDLTGLTGFMATLDLEKRTVGH